MELGSFDVDGGHFFIRNLDPLRVTVGIELTANTQTRSSSGRGDQVHNHAVADQRFGTPVQSDEREEAMLDLVPLAGARRKVTDRNLDPNLIGEALQLAFPQPQTRTVAATSVRSNEQSLRVGIANAADLIPPAADGL